MTIESTDGKTTVWPFENNASMGDIKFSSGKEYLKNGIAGIAKNPWDLTNHISQIYGKFVSIKRTPF